MKNSRSLRRLLPAVLLAACVVLLSKQGDAANSFYNASGAPAQGSALSSTVMRTEFANIGAGFDKMPGLSGFGGTAIVVNGGGTGLTNTVGTLALAGNLSTAGAFSTTGAYSLTLAQQGNVTLTLPATNDTLVGRATTDTLTNKSISGSTNTLTNIGNASLTNSSVTLNGHSLSLGGSLTLGISDLSGLGTGVATFLATPSSANLLSALTTSTGSGNAVFSNAPALTNPTVGTQSPGDNSTKAASTAYVDTLFVSGTFTPTDASGAGLVFTSPVGYYRQVGKVMYVWGSLTYPSTADGTNAKIGGLPATSANLTTHIGGFVGVVQFGGGSGTPGGAAPNWLTVLKNSTTVVFAWGGGVTLKNSDLSTSTVDFYASYPL